MPVSSCRNCLVLVFVGLLYLSPISGQTLARRGWAGSGLTVENWWQSAVLYQVDPATFEDTKGNGSEHLRGLAEHLDYLQSLSIDALVLSPFPLAASGVDQPFNPAYGTEEDLASLIQEASRRKIRILVDLPFNNTLSGEATINTARFWLSRGIAGLRLVDSDPPGATTLPALTAAQTAARLADLEHLCASYPGQRILFWDLLGSSAAPITSPGPLAVTHHRRHTSRVRPGAHPLNPLPDSSSSSPQLVLDPRLLQLNDWEASALHALLTKDPRSVTLLAAPVFESDAANHTRSFDRFSDGTHPVDIAKQAAAVLLLGPAVPRLYFGQELGTETSTTSVALEDTDQNSLLNWYRRLSTIRHSNVALRSGSLDLLAMPEPDTVAWVRRAPPGTTTASPVVVLCNLSTRAVMVSLSTELRALGISPGTGLLRTLASSSDSGLDAPVSINDVALPAHSVYVGEFRLQPGLESAPTPTRNRSGHFATGHSTSGR